MTVKTNLVKEITLHILFPCNLRCKHCYLYGIADYDRDYMGTTDKDIMSFAVFRNAVDPLIDAGVNATISILGGEPTLHPQLPDIIRYVKESRERANIKVRMFTNGTRLDKCGQELIDAGIDKIYVSLDGHNPEINDRVRGYGAFEKALRGLEFIQALRTREGSPVRLAIAHTVTKESYHSLVKLGQFAERVGVDELLLMLAQFVPREDGLAAQEELKSKLGISFKTWQDYGVESLMNEIDPNLFASQLEELNRTKWKFDIEITPAGYSISELAASYFNAKWDKTFHHKTCPVLDYSLGVLPNGDVVPCSMYMDPVVGNIRENRLDEVLDGEIYSHFRQLVMKQLLPTCKRCCIISEIIP